MRSRASMPMYAEYDAGFTVTGEMLRLALKGRKHPAYKRDSESVRIAIMRDGSAWAQWRGDAVFWAHRWYLLPKTVCGRLVAADSAWRASLASLSDLAKSGRLGRR